MTMMLLDSDDDDAGLSWKPPSEFANHKNISSVTYDILQQKASLGINGGKEHGDLRLTPSGMFMPYGDGEDDTEPAGLLRQAVDTLNTAKDIAYVIWNVG